VRSTDKIDEKRHHSLSSPKVRLDAVQRAFVDWLIEQQQQHKQFFVNARKPALREDSRKLS
jgi:hypothetical protein